MKELKELVLEGNADELVEAVKVKLNDGISHNSILDEMVMGIQKVGDLFEKGELYLPDMMLAANALKSALNIINPYFAKDNINNYSIGKIVIATVQGDVHNIGKDLVAVMLESAGFNVIDLGVNVSSRVIIEAAESNNADIVALSTLLSTGIPEMAKVINELKDKKLRDKIKVLIGGAPVDNNIVEKIGADGYGENAVSAVQIAKGLLIN